MSVSAVGSLPITSPYYTTPATGTSSAVAATSVSPAKPKGQFRSDFATLLKDVQSGDMQSAQQALAAVQSDISAASGTYSQQSTSSSTQLPPDLQNLFDAVQKGDPTAAKDALTKLQADAPQNRGTGGAHGHHHHHHAGGANDADAASTSGSTATLSASSVASTDPVSALTSA